MAATNEAAVESTELELVITRIIDAPRSLVFKAWTEPEHLMRWWGPRGFTLPFCSIDLRSGGAYRFHMRSPEGSEHWSQGVFREVVVPERLVLAGSWVDSAGQPTSPQTLLTVTFAEHEGKTKLTLHNVGFDSAAARDSHRGGWTSSLERLVEYIASQR